MKKIIYSAIAFIFIHSLQGQELLRNKENAHGAEILSAAINPEAKFIITGGADKRLYIWDAKTGDKVPKAFSTSTPVTSMAYSANGKTFICGTADGKITVYDAKEQSVKKYLFKV